MNNSVFVERLKRLRAEKNMSQKEFSDLVGITQQTLSGYETGKMKPPFEVLVNISKNTSVSLDWLCGLSDRMKPDDEYELYSDVFRQLIVLGAKSGIGVSSAHIAGREQSVIMYPDTVAQKFLPGWGKMLELMRSDVIDYELYLSWAEAYLDKFKVSQHDINGIEEWLSLQDLI